MYVCHILEEPVHLGRSFKTLPLPSCHQFLQFFLGQHGGIKPLPPTRAPSTTPSTGQGLFRLVIHSIQHGARQCPVQPIRLVMPPPLLPRIGRGVQGLPAHKPNRYTRTTSKTWWWWWGGWGWGWGFGWGWC